MATIHIDTDVLRQLSGHFTSLNTQIQNDIGSQINSLKNELDSTWQGVSHTHFLSLYQDWQTHSTAIVNAGAQLSQHLNTTATQFDNVDQQG